MICIVAHLFHRSLSRRVLLCLLPYLLCFLSFLHFLYDGIALQGPRRFPLFMNIIDLRQTTVRQIEPLLEEEARHWRDELHWDYRGALELIKRFMEAHTSELQSRLHLVCRLLLEKKKHTENRTAQVGTPCWRA